MDGSKKIGAITGSFAQGEDSDVDLKRRALLKQPVLAAAALGASKVNSLDVLTSSFQPKRRPNVILYHSDQFRWDFVCAAGQNPMDFTPNLDTMYRRGTVFENFVTNQPLCSPSRSCLMTGQYATTTKVWRNGPGLVPDAVTIATEFKKAGYSANYIGKWHLAPLDRVGVGAVPLQYRGGFTDFWVAANAPEESTQPYNSQFWNRDNQPVAYGDDVYRVDFLTRQAQSFLRMKHEKPFLLVISQLEPHQQNGPCGDNDVFGFVPPRGYAEKFRSPYVPADLKALPGDWPYELNKYYGDIKAIDESLGRIFQTLKEENLEDETIVIFTSDHACHFRTRNAEYKCSGHESSIHVPLIIQGPGFDRHQKIPELVSMIDVFPSLLDSVGLPIPSTVQGQSFLPLVRDPEAHKKWPNEVFIQISGTGGVARALRTSEWTYVALAPDADVHRFPGSMRYRDYQMYNNRADPAQLVNLAGRVNFRVPTDRLVHFIGERAVPEVTAHLRERLIERMVEAGEARPQIDYWPYYP